MNATGTCENSERLMQTGVYTGVMVREGKVLQ